MNRARESRTRALHKDDWQRDYRQPIILIASTIIAIALVFVLLFAARRIVFPEAGAHIARAEIKMTLQMQVALIISIGFLILVTARIAPGRRYLKTWILFWFVLTISYICKLLQPSALAAEAEVIFTILSSSLMFLFAYQLYLNNAGMKLEVAGFLLVFVTGWVGYFVASSRLYEVNIPTVYISDAALASVCTVFAGIAVFRYSGRFGSIGMRILGATPFALYGLLQLLGPWQLQPSFSQVIYIVALVLKVLCTLSIVTISLHETFLELEAARASASVDAKAARLARSELEKTVDELNTTKAADRLRTEAFEAYASVLRRSRDVQNAIESTLDVTMRLFNARRALLLSISTQDASQYVVYRVVTRGDPQHGGDKLAIGPLEVLDTTTPAARDAYLQHMVELCAPLMAVPGKNRSSIPRLLQILDTEGNELGVMTMDISGADEYVIANNWVVDEVLERLVFGFDNLIYREAQQVVRKVEQVLASFNNIQDRLERLAEIAARIVGASRACIFIGDDASDERRFADWPLGSFWSYALPCKMPDKVQASFHAVAGNTQVDSYQYVSHIEVPIRRVDGPIIGVLICEALPNVDGDRVAPFAVVDTAKLIEIAKFAGLVIDRDIRQVNTEILQAKGVHELKAPVANIRNILRLIRKSVTPGAQSHIEKSLEAAEGEIERLKKLIQRVRPRRGIGLEKPQPRLLGDRVFVFDDIIRRVLADIRNELRAMGYRDNDIDIDVGGVEEIPPILVDKELLTQAIQNVAGNAIKYRNKESAYFKMVFVGSAERLFYALDVSDWGIGVPGGWEEAIFEHEVRAPNAVEQEVEGEGIGLGLARSIMQDMGGRLVLERNVSPTTFRFYLPKGVRS